MGLLACWSSSSPCWLQTLYWLYDNMAILARLKVAPHVDYDRASYNSDLAWCVLLLRPPCVHATPPGRARQGRGGRTDPGQ